MMNTTQNLSPAPSAWEVADFLGSHEATTLADIHSMIHHPRSLSRPLATWRPPTKTLPRIPGHGLHTLAITRHRVGERARARVRGYGEELTPAYLISLRITDRAGAPVDPAITEGWIRAIVGEAYIEAVHEIAGARSATYVWMVDGAYEPLRSPASLYAGFSSAA